MSLPTTASHGQKSPFKQTSGDKSSADGGILLDAGTNETEILVFNVGTQRYGVNVAKVREVLRLEKVTATPQSHPAVDGVVRVREWVVPVLNLRRYLGETSKSVTGSDEQTLLLLEFNEELMAFRVDGVERIFRVNGRDTRPLPDVAATGAPVTGVVDIEGHLIQILDFEAITVIISGRDSIKIDAGAGIADVKQFADRPIVLVDDSASIRAMVRGALEEIGYTNIKVFGDGHEASEMA
jgi:two-component system chemotaxis response regulator CheV